MNIQSACFFDAPSLLQIISNTVNAQFTSLIMVPSISGLTCGLQSFYMVTVLLLFQLTCSNDDDVSLRFLVIHEDKDKNIEKVVIETARLL